MTDCKRCAELKAELKQNFLTLSIESCANLLRVKQAEAEHGELKADNAQLRARAKNAELERDELKAANDQLRARAKNVEAERDELKVEMELTMARLEGYKTAFKAGSKGYEWLQNNLPRVYLGQNMVVAAADYIRKLLNRREESRQGVFATKQDTTTR